MENVIDFYKEATGRSPRRTGTKNGGEYRGPCPICGGEAKSTKFCLWPLAPKTKDRGGSFICYGCGLHGDGIEFLRKFLGLGFKEACARVGKKIDDGEYGARAKVQRQKERLLAPEAEVAMKEPRHIPPIRLYGQDVLDQALYQRRLSDFSAWCHTKLLFDDDVKAYLAGRGVPLELCKKYLIGMNPGSDGGDIFRNPADWGLQGSRKLCLPRGITIPWFCTGGYTSSFRRVRIRRFDTADGKWPKYHVVRGGAMDTWISRLDAPVYLVVETELDAIMLESVCGDMAGIIALGSISSKPDETAAEALSRASRVFLCLDYELLEDSKKGAQEALRRTIRWWQAACGQILELFPVPVGKDPGEFFEKSGPQAVRSWLYEALPKGLQAIFEEVIDKIPVMPEGREPQRLGEKKDADLPDITENGETDSKTCIDDLLALMRRYNLKILKDGLSIRLIEPRTGKRYPWKEARRFSYLCYVDPVTSALVFNHKAKLITYKNLLDAKEAA